MSTPDVTVVSVKENRHGVTEIQSLNTQGKQKKLNERPVAIMSNYSNKREHNE